MSLINEIQRYLLYKTPEDIDIKFKIETNRELSLEESIDILDKGLTERFKNIDYNKTCLAFTGGNDSLLALQYLDHKKIKCFFLYTGANNTDLYYVNHINATLYNNELDITIIEYDHKIYIDEMIEVLKNMNGLMYDSAFIHLNYFYKKVKEFGYSEIISGHRAGNVLTSSHSNLMLSKAILNREFNNKLSSSSSYNVDTKNSWKDIMVAKDLSYIECFQKELQMYEEFHIEILTNSEYDIDKDKRDWGLNECLLLETKYFSKETLITMNSIAKRHNIDIIETIEPDSELENTILNIPFEYKWHLGDVKLLMKHILFKKNIPFGIVYRKKEGLDFNKELFLIKDDNDKIIFKNITDNIIIKYIDNPQSEIYQYLNLDDVLDFMYYYKDNTHLLYRFFQLVLYIEYNENFKKYKTLKRV